LNILYPKQPGVAEPMAGKISYAAVREKLELQKKDN